MRACVNVISGVFPLFTTDEYKLTLTCAQTILYLKMRKLFGTFCHKLVNCYGMPKVYAHTYRRSFHKIIIIFSISAVFRRTLKCIYLLSACEPYNIYDRHTFIFSCLCEAVDTHFNALPNLLSSLSGSLWKTHFCNMKLFPCRISHQCGDGGPFQSINLNLPRTEYFRVHRII